MVRDFDRIKVERLRASQQKINALSEAMEKGLLLVSNEGKIYYANAHFKKVLNLGEKNIVNLPLEKVIQNDKLQKVLGEIREIPKDQVMNDIKIRAEGA